MSKFSEIDRLLNNANFKKADYLIRRAEKDLDNNLINQLDLQSLQVKSSLLQDNIEEAKLALNLIDIEELDGFIDHARYRIVKIKVYQKLIDKKQFESEIDKFQKFFKANKVKDDLEKDLLESELWEIKATEDIENDNLKQAMEHLYKGFEIRKKYPKLNETIQTLSRLADITETLGL